MGIIRWLKELYDWAGFADAIWAGIHMMLGYSAGGGIGAMVLSVLLGASGYQAMLVGLAAFIAVNLFGIHKELKRPRPPFEILFDHLDSQFVERLEHGGFRYFAALHILAPHTVNSPNVWALRSPFTQRIILPYHGANPTHPAGNVQIL